MVVVWSESSRWWSMTRTVAVAFVIALVASLLVAIVVVVVVVVVGLWWWLSSPSFGAVVVGSWRLWLSVGVVVGVSSPSFVVGG